jgi:hypothetical protein
MRYISRPGWPIKKYMYICHPGRLGGKGPADAPPAACMRHGAAGASDTAAGRGCGNSESEPPLPAAGRAGTMRRARLGESGPDGGRAARRALALLRRRRRRLEPGVAPLPAATVVQRPGRADVNGIAAVAVRDAIQAERPPAAAAVPQALGTRPGSVAAAAAGQMPGDCACKGGEGDACQKRESEGGGWHFVPALAGRLVSPPPAGRLPSNRPPPAPLPRRRQRWRSDGGRRLR